MRHRPAAVLVTTSVVGLGLLLSALPANAATTANLIKNPGAEAKPGGSGPQVVPIPKWTRQPAVNATVVKYGSPNGFPGSKTPGPPSRGKNFFAGGPMTSPGGGALTQKVSLSAQAAKIDAGRATFAVSGWFGGAGSEPDNAGMELTFSDKNGSTVKDITLGFVTNAQRGNVTKFLKRSASGAVPPGVRTVLVQLIFSGSVGQYDDGYADNLSLTLTTH